MTATSFVGSGANLTSLPVPTTITVADESSDTTCYPLFATATTGNLAPKTGTNLEFNSASGNLRAASVFCGTTSNESKTQDGLILERNSGDGECHITAGRSGGNYGGMQFYVAGASGVTKRHQIDYQSNFRWYGADGTTERFRITNGGQVCIGTDTAVRALTIKQPGQIHLESTDTGNWLGVSLKGSSGTNNYNAYFGLLDSNGDFFIDNGSNGNDFVITQSGQVSISSGLNVTGVGTFGGVTIGYDTTTYSPIQKSDNTWFYTRLDQSSSISGTNIINLAQGSSKISDSIPRSVMTRQSDAGSYSLYHSSSTNGSAFTNFSAADPFSPSTHGLTMGCLVRLHESGNNGSGVIFYGDTNSDNHFFVRYKYSSGGLRVGEDTDGSDNWSLAYPTDRFTNDNWYFVVFAVAGNGTLYVSLNGEEKIPIRTVGSPPTPTDARFGVCGDPYADNDSRHRYATMFWYKGLMPNDMIKAEYDWLKTIWTGASLP